MKLRITIDAEDGNISVGNSSYELSQQATNTIIQRIQSNANEKCLNIVDTQIYTPV